MWQLMWRNVRAVTLNTMFQLLVIYRYRCEIFIDSFQCIITYVLNMSKTGW